MGFYDGKGFYRNEGDAFYDGKGIYRKSGDSFYDSEGIYRKPGDSFYDSKGIYRKPGDSFYDSEGIYRKPGDSFYDSERMYQTQIKEDKSSNEELNQVGTAGWIFILLIILSVIAAILGIFLIWYSFFRVMLNNPDAEGIIYSLSVLFCFTISTFYVCKKGINVFVNDASKFYIFNCIITYIILNIEAIFIGDFGVQSLLGGAFIVALLSVLPTFIIIPIVIAIKKRK